MSDGLPAPSPHHHTGGPGTTYYLAPTLWHLWIGWHYQHSSLGYWDTQASPLLQGHRTSGKFVIYAYNICLSLVQLIVFFYKVTVFRNKANSWETCSTVHDFWQRIWTEL